jgi:hypothetical protein
MFEVNGRFKMVLSVISVLAGTLVALITVALLWREKIYVDAATKQITKIDLPFGIKLQTNAPLIAIVFIAAGLILVPVMKHKEQNMVVLRGHVKTRGESLKVYAIAAQQETNGDVVLEVPGDTYYTVMYLPIDGAPALDSKFVDLVNKHDEPFALPEEEINTQNAGLVVGPTHREAPDVVGQYK